VPQRKWKAPEHEFREGDFGALEPKVCISGQMSIAARQLLMSLIDAGVEVAYHGDFDWGGLEIGNQVIRLGAVPWRYGTADYLAAVRADVSGELQGRCVHGSHQARSATFADQG
jgi:hypothetical protein